MRRSLALALALLLLCPAARAWAVDADEANDICPPTADPCLVTQSYDVVNGATLDFGTRSVQVKAGGQIDTNDGVVKIFCGNFTVDAGLAIGLKVRGTNSLGLTDGGTLSIVAQRRCELDSDRICVGDANCELGTCSVSVCSGDTSRVCASDAACQLTCGVNKLCSGTARPCEVEADCQLGTCTASVCSGSRATECSSDADCDFGECSVGQANVQLLSLTRADGGTGGGIPGTVVIRAAGDVNVGSEISANSASGDTDGGFIDIESEKGSVTVAGLLSATGGGRATGGEVSLTAGTDVTVNQSINVSGGDYDGGIVEISAERDVFLNQAIRGDSTNGGGFGGEVAITAGRDIRGASLGSVSVDGHYSSVENYGGWGGTIEWIAGRDLTVGSGEVLSAIGALPDGFGGEIVLDATESLTLAGTAEPRVSSTATQGVGGDVDITAGTFVFPVGGLIDARGAQGGGGAVYVVTQGPMTFDGTMDARATSSGTGANISIDIGGDVTMSGKVRMAGKPTGNLNGEVDFEFCRLTMQSGALIENVGQYGKNTLRARERVTIASGATISADAATGVNRVVYRDEAKPPVLNGTVTPAAVTSANEFLPGCPVCGNNELDGGETCEDGNTNNGDGCNSDCQDEACVGQTPGYPDVPVCDDGNGCTQDVCSEHQCTNIDSCDDGIDCTIDSCATGSNACIHTTDNSACDDGNPCTDDICLQQEGCVPLNNSGVCDDGAACTSDDRCTSGLCLGDDACGEGQTCNLETDECEVGGICGDGFVDALEECDNGEASWVAGESCDENCAFLACGDPNDSDTKTASDALFILRTAVELTQCAGCVCDLDGNGATTASDALQVLRAAVELPARNDCPACV